MKRLIVAEVMVKGLHQLRQEDANVLEKRIIGDYRLCVAGHCG